MRGVWSAMVLAAATLSGACGGGGGGGKPGGAGPPPPATFTVGGMVSGLEGSGLLVRKNGANDLMPGNGSFVFPGAQPAGSPYEVTIAAQPTQPRQTCLVGQGSGTIGSANVTNVRIECTTDRFTIGVVVSGLQGSGLRLRNNGADELAVTADGTHTFATPVASGAGYAVTVAQQPANPAQVCSVTRASGMVTEAPVGDVLVECEAGAAQPEWTVGGTVTGLRGSGMVLVGAQGQVLPITANGEFVFTDPLEDGTAWRVQVDRQPRLPAQTCVVANDSGVIAGADVRDIAVSCTDVPFNSLLDPGFGTDGIKRVDFNGNDDRARAVVLQPDGKILVAGSARSANGVVMAFALARLNPDGSLDDSFGQGGRVTTPVGTISATASAMALQPDGRIVLAGTAFVGSRFRIAAARYLADGNLDPDFAGGVVTVPLGLASDAQAVAIQPDGAVVLAGSTRETKDVFAVVRLNPDGSLDGGFDADGTALIDFPGGQATAHAVAIRADGRIVVAGGATGSGVPAFALAVLESDGTLGSFGVIRDAANGIGAARALRIQPDDRLVVAGYAAEGMLDQFALTRYTAGGGTDITFNDTGRLHVDLGAGDDEAYALAPRSGGWALAGRSFNGVNMDFALLRCSTDGELDASFGDDGRLVLGIGGADDEAYGIAVQPDDKLVVVGDSVDGAFSDFAVVRVLD
ncbi:MAG TPA: hypothetical protein VFL16_16595 [Steroidobacteraceae bacterium]|jgi:uncharacterized delta-60 repeat protein|nr:hypothetical protein [Steroidobacteraceae bacterium]